MSLVAGDPVRIAQVSPLYEAVPPAGYGGTERVVSYLTEELVRRGTDVDKPRNLAKAVTVE